MTQGMQTIELLILLTQCEEKIEPWKQNRWYHKENDQPKIKSDDEGYNSKEKPQNKPKKK